MKKGISPLIATVLIIGMTIVLAGIVGNFLIKSAKEKDFSNTLGGENEYCDEVAIAITETSGDPTVIEGYTNCNIGDTYNLYSGLATVKNKGSFSIYHIIMAPEGGTSVDITFDDAILPGKSIDVNPIFCDQNKVQLTPVIKNPEYEGEFDLNVLESQIICTSSSATIDLSSAIA
ncbi:MAG TPA: archaellin/type IV pilin N-terminal domain-containing protein [Candidatus Nanoarchaeia archaeon]|nr:archaellin/type IV pilin N-terminal domain-containing protein [Candidatus Nanoarchaeia archaeon]